MCYTEGTPLTERHSCFAMISFGKKYGAFKYIFSQRPPLKKPSQKFMISSKRQNLLNFRQGGIAHVAHELL